MSAKTKGFSTPSRSLALLIAALLIGAGLLIFGFYAGYARGSATPKHIVVDNVVNVENQEEVADFALFWEVWQRLKEMHIDGAQATSQDFLYSAIKGLAGAFSDPYTNFFPPLEAAKFKEDISGKFGGIGAEIGKDENDILIVIAPLKRTPADRAGLKTGDYILKIDGLDTDGLDVEGAVGLIRGTPGSAVVLNIFRREWGEARDMEIVREIIKVPTLDLTFEDDIAYLQLYSFNENAANDFRSAANTILTNKAKGIILDLRNNPGGYLEAATYMAGWFVDSGAVLVSERFREGEDRVFRSEGNGALKNIPTVVLINGGSASASEILAGALHDLRQTPLVGTKSFGKGTVQEVTELSNGSTLKVTVARWVLPNGTIIDKEGIEPDYLIEPSEEEGGEDVEAEKDLQFEKALEVLRKELGI